MAVDLIADQGPRIVGVAGGFMAAITLTMIARLYARARMVGSVGVDDWTMLLATSTSIALSAITILEVRYGAGKHIQDIPPDVFKHGMMLNFISQVLSICAIAFVKMSICLFLLRLATKPIYRRICYGILIFTGLYNLSCALEVIFQCTPIARAWDRTMEGQCMSATTLIGLAYTFSILMILTDFFLVIPMVWDVRIPTRQKALICFILGFGSFAMVSSIVRMTYNINYGKTGDFLWDSTNLTIWVIIEIDTAIITASMPAFKPLFRCILKKTGYSSGSTRRLSNAHPLQPLHFPIVQNEIFGNSHSTSDRNLNGSEESIFPQASNMGAIAKSTEVTMDIEQLGNEHSLENRQLSGQFPVPV
ncbi:hypothetical protein RUND412_001513 [Rhizina undulata]